MYDPHTHASCATPRETTATRRYTANRRQLRYYVVTNITDNKVKVAV